MVELNFINQKACQSKQQFFLKFNKNYIFMALWNMFFFPQIQFYFLPNSVFH